MRKRKLQQSKPSLDLTYVLWLHHSVRHFYSLITFNSMGDKDYDEYHIRHCMLYEFRKGSNALQAKKNICAAYPGAVTVRKCQQLLNKFKKGDWMFSEEPVSADRPRDSDNDHLKESMEEDTHKKNKSLAKKHKISTTQDHPRADCKENKGGNFNTRRR